MTEKTVGVTEETKERRESVVLDTIRSVLLAGIGALALTKEELEAITNRLVQKGELAEQDARKMVQDLLEKRKKDAEQWEDQVTQAIEARVKRVLERLNIPTRQDFNALQERLDALEKKLDELTKGNE